MNPPKPRQASRLRLGQAFHASQLSLTHPRTGKRLTFGANLPTVMQVLIDLLREVCLSSV